MSNVIPLIPALLPATIAEDEVTSARLSGLLEAAFMDNNIDDDGDIYISDGLQVPAWVEIDGERKLLSFVTMYPTDDHPNVNWLVHVNEMNREATVPQFWYQENAVWGSYCMTFDGGLNVRQFVKMLRIFGGAFWDAFGFYKDEPVHVDGR